MLPLTVVQKHPTPLQWDVVSAANSIAILSISDRAYGVLEAFNVSRSTATELKFLFGGVCLAQILVKLFAHWFVDFRTFLHFTPATHVYATHVKVRLRQRLS